MSAAYREQHKRRLSWMPWLWARLKPADRAWAQAWQAEVQAALMAVEKVTFGEGCFLSPQAQVFAEPKREVVVGAGTTIAAEVYLHGPVALGERVGLNPRVHIEGGRAGVVIGDHTAVATGVRIFAFDHGFAPDALIRDQPQRSRGVRIGRDVWIGAGAGVTDGVRIGDHAIVGMGAVVTRDVPDWGVAMGVPARIVGDRRTWKAGEPS